MVKHKNLIKNKNQDKTLKKPYNVYFTFEMFNL